MKKHLFTLILALLLASLASVAAAQDYYTLPEIRAQAAQGWHQTYTDKYGRTRQVDVDIDVFGENVAPVLKACWGIKRFKLKGPSDGPRAAIQMARKKGNGKSIYLYENVPYMKVNLDEKYMESYGNDLTLREVYDYCEELILGQGLNLYQEYMWEMPYQFSVLYSADKDTGELLVPGMYDVSFCQKEYGMPILTHAGTSFELLQVPFTCPTLNFQMRDRDTYICVGNDFDVAEILAEDIPLCSVGKAIEGTREMIESGYIHDVLGLRFGYVVYGDPDLDWKKRLPSDEMETWYLVPSWVMDCHVLDNPQEDDPEKSYHMQIAINAQTGKMMDYFDKSLSGGGDVRYKGFISWDDVK